MVGSEGRFDFTVAVRDGIQCINEEEARGVGSDWCAQSFFEATGVFVTVTREGMYTER